ncbi:MAG: hypothetical protein ACRYGR_01585 [Janthinobacterium lividum]
MQSQSRRIAGRLRPADHSGSMTIVRRAWTAVQLIVLRPANTTPRADLLPVGGWEVGDYSYRSTARPRSAAPLGGRLGAFWTVWRESQPID